MSSYEYTYICSWGPNAAQVLYYSEGTKAGDPANVKKPDAVGQVTVAGDAEGRPFLQSNVVEGQLFKCQLDTGRMGGGYMVYWMIDPDASTAKVNERVGRAVAVRRGAGGAPPTYNVVGPVWKADKGDMGLDQKVARKRLYYFQNNYYEGRSVL